MKKLSLQKPPEARKFRDKDDFPKFGIKFGQLLIITV